MQIFRRFFAKKTDFRYDHAIRQLTDWCIGRLCAFSMTMQPLHGCGFAKRCNRFMVIESWCLYFFLYVFVWCIEHQHKNDSYRVRIIDYAINMEWLRHSAPCLTS